MVKFPLFNMRSFFEDKRWIIFISLLGLGSLILLSVGLRDIPFRDGLSFGGNQIVNIRSVPINIINSIVEVPFWMQVSVSAIFILMFVLIGWLMTPEWRKRMIRIAIRAGLTYWALYIIFKRYRDLLAGLNLNQAADNSGLASASAGDTLPAFA